MVCLLPRLTRLPSIDYQLPMFLPLIYEPNKHKKNAFPLRVNNTKSILNIQNVMDNSDLNLLLYTFWMRTLALFNYQITIFKHPVCFIQVVSDRNIFSKTRHHIHKICGDHNQLFKKSPINWGKFNLLLVDGSVKYWHSQWYKEQNWMFKKHLQLLTSIRYA